MFSYQHRYHAGGYCDVHKHLVLMAILGSLQKKDSPFAVLDLHAGEGLYNIQSKESQKTKEYKNGFHKLQSVSNPLPLIKSYIDIIGAFNTDSNTSIYPGSPAIASHFLREHDRLICVEAHPQASTQLNLHFRKHPQIHLHERDAFEALNALLPFKEKRGLTLIDPSYEVKTEYKAIARAINTSFVRFAQGIYAIWYPLLGENYHQQLLTGIQRSALTKVWYCEWAPFPKKPEDTGLLGSGMVVVNMPWQIDTQLKEAFAWLNSTIYKQGHFREGWI